MLSDGVKPVWKWERSVDFAFAFRLEKIQLDKKWLILVDFERSK